MKISIQQICSVCFEIFTEDSYYTLEISTTWCRHTFHTDCISKWLLKSKECPECQQPCTKKQVQQVFSNRLIDPHKSGNFFNK